MKLVLQESFYWKCVLIRGPAELSVPGKVTLVLGQIRRPEDRNFKPLCIYFIASCNRTWTKTPTVLLVEMFKLHG